MKSKEKLNIYQKLLEVRKSIPYLQYNSNGYNYKYVNESSLLGLLRSQMDEQGLFLEISMLSLEVIGSQKDSKYIKSDNKNIIIDVPITKATVEFTWVNCDNPCETITKQMIMQRPGGDCQEVGSMLTYANRYFLLKFFSIPTDKDDPDLYNKKVEQAQEKNEETLSNKLQNKATISDEEWTVLDDYLNGDDELRTQLKRLCQTTNLRYITHKQLKICGDYARKYKQRIKDEKKSA